MILLTDGMFAHDGSAAPLKEYLWVLPSDGMLLVDDAHGAGVLGKTGKGTIEYAGVSRNRHRVIQTLTLSKAFGAYGGAILGTAKLRKAIMERSALFAGHTPVPLPLAGAAMESTRLLAERGKILRGRLRANSRWLKERLQELGFPAEAMSTPGPIICLMPKSSKEVKGLQRAFLKAGIFPPITRYPGLPTQGYVRIVVSSEHTKDDLDGVAGVLND
jgi:7-keto-8-aminopelargonate synthetase-like enzyme